MITDRGLSELVTQLTDMTESVVKEHNLEKFDLRRVLRFISKVIQVIEQSFQDVLSLLVDFKYLSGDDIASGELPRLLRDLDLLQSRSRYRDAEEICSRLHFLSDYYRMEIEPLVRPIADPKKWMGVFGLLNEYEGRIIELVHRSVYELSQAVARADPQEINSIAGDQYTQIEQGLRELRSLNSQILGLSGSTGLLELTEDRRALEESRIVVNQTSTKLGDTYNVQQAGAVGPHARVKSVRMSQHVRGQATSFNTEILAKELAKLRVAMRKASQKAEHDIALSEVAKAEKAARGKKKAEALRYLKNAGKWALSVATKIGVPVAVAALKQAAGMP